MMFFKKIATYSRNAYLYSMAFGIILIIFGILLLVMPELLAYLVSFCFIVLGIITFSVGWRIRKAEQGIRRRVEHVSETIKGDIETIKDTFEKR